MQTSLAGGAKARRSQRGPAGFVMSGETRKIKSQHAGGMLLPPVQKLVATAIFSPIREKKCIRVSPGVPKPADPKGVLRVLPCPVRLERSNRNMPVACCSDCQKSIILGKRLLLEEKLAKIGTSEPIFD